MPEPKQTRYRAYPAYKPSGVDWLGDIPADWLSIQIGRLYRRTKRTGHVGKELLSVYRDHGVVPKSSRDDNNNKASEDLSPYQLVEQDDLVLNKMKTWQGSIAISDHEGIVSPAYFVYQPEPKLYDVANPKYVHFLVRNPMYIAQYLRRSKGIRVSQWDLDPGEFQRIELLLPSLPEQTQIAAFLDYETAKIDALIVRQQRLIALLEEKRQAVISHAVTKGLNPDAPMRPSGIDWLGDVPAHWGTTRIKFEVSEISDCLHITPTYEGELKYPAVRTADVSPGVLDLENARLVSEKIYNERICRLRPRTGDVLYSREGERFGMAALVPENTELCLGQRMMLFRVKESLNAGFFMWSLNSASIVNQVLVGVSGSTSPHVNIGDIRNFEMALPPVEEQEQIFDEIISKTAKADKTISLARSTITLLKERRTALISAAVTGKIDVRGWTPPDKKDTAA